MATKRTIDRWSDLRARVAVDDGLVTREARAWTFDKLWWWNRYIEITTTAMVGNPNWSNIVYVDLFCGPGVCATRDGAQRVPGSPLLAAFAPKPFNRLLLCEENVESANACKERLKTHAPTIESTLFTGDCNNLITDICGEIPDSSLSIAFVDPTGLHANFETIRELTMGRAVDLFILFADGMDIVRNVELYASQDHSKLDRVLGAGCDWRMEWKEMSDHSPASLCRLFAGIYKRQLEDQLGYRFSADEVVRNTNGSPIYRLLYASRNPRGIDFWKKITKRERSQKRLF